MTLSNLLVRLLQFSGGAAGRFLIFNIGQGMVPVVSG
jgi:hypothetical protein